MIMHQILINTVCNFIEMGSLVQKNRVRLEFL